MPACEGGILVHSHKLPHIILESVIAPSKEQLNSNDSRWVTSYPLHFGVLYFIVLRAEFT
jgi:hypothetical protein